MALHIPRPPYDLRFFNPFIEYFLNPIQERLAIPDARRSVLAMLELKPSMPNKTSSYCLRQSSTIDDAVEAGVMQFVISQVGWLSWEDYIWLVVASKNGGFAGVVTLLIWTRNPKRLEKEVTFLSSLLKQSDIAPFAPVLRKVIERYMLEVEMRKKQGG
jgi:hypothetical protein